MEKWRIIWISSTLIVGWGQYCLTKLQANEWVSRMEQKYPTMKHWAQKEY